MALGSEADYVFRERYPERDQIYARFDQESEALRHTAKALLDVPYGHHPRARFDLFWATRNRRLVVFIHGGYWQSHSRDRYSFVAAPLIKQGYTVAVLGYPLVPEITIAGINSWVLDGLRQINELLRSENQEPDRMIMTGHSAGGHLAACASLKWDSASQPLSALMPLSGIFDLEPIIETSVNKALCLDRATAQASSPIHQPPPPAPVVAFVGKDETRGFQRQSRNFVDHCNASNPGRAELVLIDHANHYSILLDFFQPDSKIVGKINDHMDCRRKGQK